jgi:hypothetical protein
MTGILLPILERSDYNFTPTTAGLMAEIPLAQNIDVSQYRECTLLLRVHALTLSNAASTIAIRARRVAPSEEDPAVFFRDQSTSWTATAVNNTTPGTLIGATVGPNTGGWLSFFLVVNQGSAGTTLTATLSAELSLKDS